MTAPHATPRSTLPPAHHHHQDIAALQDRLTRLSQASLNNNESLDLDDVVAERWHGWRWLCHIQAVAIPKMTAPRVDLSLCLIVIIAELLSVIERLQRRKAELECQAKSGGPPRMPGLKAKSARKPPA